MSLRPRIIPVLLLKNGGLVKTKKFKDAQYVGDPINAVKIFNEKEVDELLLFDIECGKNNKEPDYELISNIASEAFMPVGYGGGIRTAIQAKKIIDLGVEKVILNSGIQDNLNLVSEVSSILGSSSVVACIDYKKNIFGSNKVCFKGGSVRSNHSIIDWAKELQDNGAGEIILNSIDKEGTYSGYDIETLKSVSRSIDIPLVISGGCGSLHDIQVAISSGASGAAAGSMFVYKRPHNAVLINYPTFEELTQLCK